MRISDWSSDVCSSDLLHPRLPRFDGARLVDQLVAADEGVLPVEAQPPPLAFGQGPADIDVPTVGLDRAEVVEDVVAADDLAALAAVVGGAGHRVALDHAALEAGLRVRRLDSVLARLSSTEARRFGQRFGGK